MASELDGPAVDAGVEVRAGCHATCQHDVSESIHRLGEVIEDAGSAAASKLQDAQRCLKKARNAVEDTISDTRHELKHHPFRSASIAFGAGIILGFLAPRFRPKRRAD